MLVEASKLAPAAGPSINGDDLGSRCIALQAKAAGMQGAQTMLPLILKAHRTVQEGSEALTQEDVDLADRLLREVEPTIKELTSCASGDGGCGGAASPAARNAGGTASAGSAWPAASVRVVEHEARALAREVLAAFHLCRGLQQGRAGRLLASTSSLCEALKLDPTMGRAWRARAEAWMGLRVPALALRNLRMALRADPEDKALQARVAEVEDVVVQEGPGPALSLEGAVEGWEEEEGVEAIASAVARYEEATVLFQEGFFKSAARRYLACLRALDRAEGQQLPPPPPAPELQKLRVASLLSVASTCVQRCMDLRLASACCERVLGPDLCPGHAGALALMEAIEEAWERPKDHAQLYDSFRPPPGQAAEETGHAKNDG